MLALCQNAYVHVLSNDEELISAVQNSFARWPVHVCASDNWRSSLEIIRRNPPVQVVVDKSLLGERVSDFVRRVRGRHPNTPILVLTEPHAPIVPPFTQPTIGVPLGSVSELELACV